MNILSIGLRKVALLGTSLLLTAAVGVEAATKSPAAVETGKRDIGETISQSSQPLLVAQTRNYCRKGESLFVSAETRGFWVNICGGDYPGTYVGVNKRNGNSIRLPLVDYDQQGNYFAAVNGNVSYLLIRGTTKGDFLTVTQGRRELFRQPILNWE
jgi:hypothetical protein